MVSTEILSPYIHGIVPLLTGVDKCLLWLIGRFLPTMLKQSRNLHVVLVSADIGSMSI
jgi:hypothetical protein